MNHICSVLVENLQKNLFRFRPVAIERDTYLYLVPDVFEALIVVGLRHREYPSVGNMDDASRTLFGINTVNPFENRELKEPYVDDISLIFADLYTVTYRKRFSHHDKEPSGHILQQVFECNGDPCGE